MASYQLLTLVNGKEKVRTSANETLDFLSLRIGSSNLTIAQLSATAFDFSSKKLSNVADPVAAQDAMTKNYADGQYINKNGTLTYLADQPMGGFKLTGLAAGSAAGHSVRYEQVILRDGSQAFTAAQSMGSFKLTNLANPTADQDAATKFYVDGVATGLDFKASVRVATTANITLSAPQTVDGVVLVAGNRVLVKDQTTATENGIYDVAAGAWTRSSDADNSPGDEVSAGMFTFVEEGSSYQDTGWVLATDNPIVLGTTSLLFTQFSSAGVVLAGAGLLKTGNVIDVQTADASMTINANDIQVKRDAAGAVGLSGSGIAVNVDGVGIEINTNALRLKDNGVTEFKLNASVAGDMIAGGGGTALSVDLHSVSGLESSNPGNAAGLLRVKLEAVTPSLMIDGSNQLAAKLDAAGTITSGAGGLKVGVDNSTIEISSNALRVKAAGIAESHLNASVAGDMIAGGAGTALSVDLHTVSGLESSNPGNAAGQLRIKLEASNPSLKFTGSNELAAKLNAAGAIVSSATGLLVQVQASNPSLFISSNELGVKLDAAGAITSGASGLIVGTGVGIEINANVLRIKSDAAGDGLGYTAGVLSVNVDNSTIEIDTDSLRVKDLGITTAKLAANSVTKAKLNSDVVGGDLVSGLYLDGTNQINLQTAAAFTNDNAGAITIRQFVYIKTGGTVDLADATQLSTSGSELGLVRDASIAAAGSGNIIVRNGAVVGGFSGLTPGGEMFLSTTPGGYTQGTPASAVGNVVVRVGYALSATQMVFDPGEAMEVLS